ncbi:thyrotropin-releasing hormone receptor-like [Watersipora subatra]|uniref:thyrotropin-releasing hormone receptor-like n=1 Tax=Watersipora subatra TaxID=2589382 RepID=UPI00355C29DD
MDALYKQSIRLEHDDYPMELMECSLEYVECQAERYIFMVGGPLLVALSIIGNSITFSVMLREKLRHTATAVFIASLAVMDTMATITGLSRHFILKTFGVDVRNLSATSCSVHRFFLYISLDTSSWLLGLIAIERFIAVCKPQHYKRLRTASMALKVVGVLVLLHVVFNMHVFWTRGINWIEVENVNDNSSTVELNCGYTSEESRFFWTHHQGWMVLVWYCIIPFTTMLVLDIFIIQRLYKLQRTSLNRTSISRTHSGVSETGLAKHTNSMTRMLLTVTLYFLIITTPVFIFTMCQSLLFYNDPTDGRTLGKEEEEKLARMELIDASLTILLYLNHSINFCLYLLTGRRFRRELSTMLNCSCNRIASTRRLSTKQSIKETQANGTNTNAYVQVASATPMLPRSFNDTNHSTCTSRINISAL